MRPAEAPPSAQPLAAPLAPACCADRVRVLDLDGGLLHAEDLGLPRPPGKAGAAPAGTPWAALWPEAARPLLAAAIGTAREHGCGRFVAPCVEADGTELWWDVLVTAMPGPAGRPERLLCVSRDVTEARRATEAIAARATRLRLLAETAGELLRATAPDAVLGRLIEGAAEAGLGVDICFYYVAEETDRALRLGCHFGVPEGVARALCRLDYGDRPCGLVAEARRPIVTPDVQATTGPAFGPARAMGMTAYAGIPIMAGDRLVGVLGFGSRTRARFDEEDVAFFVGVAHHMAAVRERLCAERALREAARLERIMAGEASHRVKNSLQLVASLLSLQANAAQDEPVRAALAEARARIATVARVHDRLWRGEERTGIDLAAFLGDLCADLESTALAGCRVSCRADSVAVPSDLAVSLGLIANELVTNAFKHASDGGLVVVALERSGPDEPEPRVRLRVTDRGPGLPEGFDPARGHRSLGMRIVNGLVGRLEGTLSASSGGPGHGGRGARFAVEVPLPPPGSGAAGPGIAGPGGVASGGPASAAPGARAAEGTAA
jgi:two-component sensor histidine kinase/putative methionine-R-sulfoxide reductase with GAF domain